MTSAINTNGINVNYPVPGINNSSQGFRDNFATIKTDLNTAATEITDLQNNAVLKQALNGTVLNNDMANTLISNAVTRGFRASTFNLGNAISGTLIVNASLGDVQYGTITGNTTIQFTGWAPSGTQSNVELQLAVGNSLAVISLPTEVQMSNGYGIETIENFANVSGTPTLTIPYDVTRLDYTFSSLDCGNTITINPYNRPRQSTQIQQRIPSPVGQQGDVDGTTSVSPPTSIAFATCTATNGTYDYITCDSTNGFYLDMPVVFTGNVFGGIIAGATYYVRAVLTATTFTISTLPGTSSGPQSIVNLTTATGTMSVNPVSYLYTSTGSYDGSIVTKYASNTNIVSTTVLASNTSSTGNLITVSGTSGFVVGYPVAFSGTLANTIITATYATGNLITVSTTAAMVVGGRIAITGNTFGGLSNALPYYITYIDSGNSNIAVSSTFNGSNISLTTGTGSCTGTYNAIMGGLVPGTDYFVQSIPSGTTFTVCENSPGGAPVALLDENGSMSVTAVTDYTITLNSTSNIANNQPIEFAGNVFGGVSSDTIYYVANIASGTDISISSTINNGLAGQKLPLSTASGNMIANVTNAGTPIWKSVQLKPYNSAADSSVVNELIVYGNLSVTGNTTVGNITGNTFTGNVSGNISAYNLTVSNLANLTTSQLKITGGTNGFVLQTDGAGNLSWTAMTGNAGNGVVGGSTTQVQFNDGGAFGGDTAFTWDKTNNILTVGNAITASGNITSGNLSVTSNVTAGNITLSANIVANNFTTTTGKVTTPAIENGTSNIKIASSGNITVTVAGNANIITATGTGANISGTLSVSGNATVGNLITTNGVFAGTIQGVTTLSANANISTSGSGSIISNNFIYTGVTTGITAAGTTQGGATALTKEFNVVSTCTGTNYGVILPSSVAGMTVMIRNNTGNTLYVYPPTSSAINALSTNTAYQQSANTTNQFYCVSSTQWYSLV